MNKERNQVNYNELIGRIDDEYYFLDYIFDDTLNGSDFKGATGSILRPVSKLEYDERTEFSNLKDNYKEIWQEAVKSGNTEESLENWLNNIINNEGVDFIFDLSYSNLAEQLREKLNLTEEEYPVIEAQGGGRCFSRGMEFDEVYNQELLNKINEVEK